MIPKCIGGLILATAALVVTACVQADRASGDAALPKVARLECRDSRIVVFFDDDRLGYQTPRLCGDLTGTGDRPPYVAGSPCKTSGVGHGTWHPKGTTSSGARVWSCITQDGVVIKTAW